MGNLKAILCLGAALLVWGGGRCWGQANHAPPILDARARSADPRLNLPLNFDADRMYLGEVLEKVSAQTGVSLSIPPEDPESGIPIICHVKKIPLADFMNSVWSLVGYSQATWQINSDTPQKPRNYRLLPTAASRALADRLIRETDQNTLKLLDVYLQMAAMTGPERRTHIHQLAEAMLLDKDEIAAGFVQDVPGIDQHWSMVHLFTTELSAAQQEQVLHGATISVPFSEMSAGGQEVIRQFGSQSHSTVNGVPVSDIPDAVRFGFSWYGIGQGTKQMMRKLSVGIVRGSGANTMDYMGIMERGMQSRLRDGWILPSDLRSKEIQKQPVNPLPNLPEKSIWSHVPAFDLVMAQIAEAQNFSFVGVAPEDRNHTSSTGQSTTSTTVSGQPAPRCLDDLRSQEGTMFKWRDGVLLFSYPLWFYGDDAQYPYAKVKQLRESRKGHVDGSPLTLAEIADAVMTLTDVQMKRLAREFGQVDDNKTNRAVFGFYQKYPGILAEKGMTTDLNMITLLKQSKLMPSLVENDSIVKLRITEQPLPQITDGRRFYRMQYQTVRQKEWREIAHLSILPDRKQ
jgi:hypothetical protein